MPTGKPSLWKHEPRHTKKSKLTKKVRPTIEEMGCSEVDLMSKLNHPHLIRLHGATCDSLLANINIFFEWMAGGSVAQLLDKHGPFAETVMCSYIYQTLLGLEYLHGMGILHRDLKGKT